MADTVEDMDKDCKPLASVAMDEASTIQAFFECVSAVVDPETQQQMVPNLQRRLESPPTAMLSSVLGQQLTDAQVRNLLFCPGPLEMALYPSLLIGDPDSPNDLTSNAANKAQAAALGHMYLVHGRTWQRLKPFIEAGGLQTLVKLLNHPNHLLTSQALQLLLLATHPDMYDWHNPPGHTRASSSCPASAVTSKHYTGSRLGSIHSEHSASDRQAAASATTSISSNNACRNHKEQSQLPQDPSSIHTSSRATTEAQQSTHPSQGPDAAVWKQLALLHQGPLLSSLLRLSPDLWPGSGFQALQLLAFYLSWLRAWWSKDGVLQLSAPLLTGLTAWSQRSTASPEERQLAAALVEDFGKAGVAPAAVTTGPNHDANIDFEPCLELKVVADRTLINSGPGSEAARLKAAGNDAFKAKDWATAIQLYSAALDVPVPAEALIDEAPRRAVYHTNRAAAYLERVWELQASQASIGSSDSGGISWREVGGLLDGLMLDSSSESVAKQLESALMDCNAAIELAPNHTKAHYRMATALRAQGKFTHALAAAAAAEQHASTAADRAAAARLAAAIVEQQKQTQQQQQQVHPQDNTAVQATRLEAGASRASVTTTTTSSSSDSSNKCHASKTAAADPLGQLLQQFAASVCRDSSSSGPGPCAKQPAANRKPSSHHSDIKLPSAVTSAVGDVDGQAHKGLTTLQMPQQRAANKKQASGKVLVEVLASSDCEEELQQGCSCSEDDTAQQNANSKAVQGFLLREVHVSNLKGSSSSNSGMQRGSRNGLAGVTAQADTQLVDQS